MKPFPEIPGVELFLCGGAVRDHLLGIKAHDRDFVALTELSFDELVKAVEKVGGEVFLAKPEFLTIRCKFGKEVIDIALPRSENNYTDGRHPDKVNRVDTLKGDASRRDFTINSMYMDRHGNIIDEFGGKKDLDNKILKTVGNPIDRFAEDFLRIIRGIRFSIKYNLSKDYDTKNAMHKTISGLHQISFERIKDELNKCLLINPKETFNQIEEYSLWGTFNHHGLWFELTNKKRPRQC